MSVCPFCNKTVSVVSTSLDSSVATLRNHLENNHGPATGFVCKICSSPNSVQHVFADSESACEHLKLKHGNPSAPLSLLLKENFLLPQDVRSFKCLKCSQLFLGQDFHGGAGILKHLSVAHGCDPMCSRLMGVRGEDRRLSFQGIVVLNCRRCQMKFVDESMLVAHGKSCLV
jgi:hypothetical protein